MWLTRHERTSDYWPAAATTRYFTVVEAPLIPFPSVELHGVTVNVWLPTKVGAHVKAKGVSESTLTTLPSLVKTTLSVFEFVCAFTV